MQPGLISIENTTTQATKTAENKGQTRAQQTDAWPLEFSKGGVTVRVFRTVSKSGYESFTIAY